MWGGGIDRPSKPDDPSGRNASAGVYAIAEARLATLGDHRLDTFMRLGATGGKGLPIAAYQRAGAVLSGRLIGAREERVGLALASAVTSDAFPCRQPVGIDARRGSS